MTNHKPYPLTLAEFNEIIHLPAIREAWGLDDDVEPQDFASEVYAVRFKYHSGSPGYVGDLYILQGDVLESRAPFLLTRDRSGELQVVE